MNEKQFIETYCHNCGTQRCEGIGTEWFEGCRYKWSLDGMEIEATAEINRLQQQNLDLATKIVHLQEQISKEEVKHGEWDLNVGMNFNKERICPICKKRIESNYWEFCSHCGAKMDGGNVNV